MRTNTTVTQEQAVSLTNELTRQLSEYTRLRGEERLLRLRVEFLEKLEARSGPMRMDIDKAISLRDSQAMLEEVRRELSALESQLQEQKNIPLAQRTEIRINRLIQLVSDVKAKREQLVIYQANVQYLEELQPKLGVTPEIAFINELRIIRQRLSEIQSELANLEIKLRDTWRVDSETIAKLPRMSDEKIKELAGQFVAKNVQRNPTYGLQFLSRELQEVDAIEQIQVHPLLPSLWDETEPAEVTSKKHSLEKQKAPNRESGKLQGLDLQSLGRRRDAQRRYNTVVKDVLQELMRSVYSDCSSESWKIYSNSDSQNDVKVAVRLEFDVNDNPLYFICCINDGNSPIMANSRDLSRKGLIESLLSILGAERKKMLSKQKAFLGDWQY